MALSEDLQKKLGKTYEPSATIETNAACFIPIIDKTWNGVIPASLIIYNSKKYYQLFNHKLPPKCFELELDKLVQ